MTSANYRNAFPRSMQTLDMPYPEMHLDLGGRASVVLTRRALLWGLVGLAMLSLSEALCSYGLMHMEHGSAESIALIITAVFNGLGGLVALVFAGLVNLKRVDQMRIAQKEQGKEITSQRHDIAKQGKAIEELKEKTS